jgi:acyl-CoA reductase-like NAD-dependent aldehyde dehydrogenase
MAVMHPYGKNSLHLPAPPFQHIIYKAHKFQEHSMSQKLVTHDPYTGKPTGEFAQKTFAQAKEDVLTLKNSQLKWRTLTVPDRLKLVKKALTYFETNREQIALDICESIGRPLHYCNGEVNGFFERANYLCDIAEATLKPDVIGGKEGFDRSIEHTPLGVIFVISAWNYPLLITVNSVVPALIAGNTVLLKHSNLTPKIGLHFENAFRNLGEHKNLLLQAIVSHDVTGQIIEQTPVDHVVFTGSVEGGHSILKHTSKKFMMPALELGGKDAAYVHSDADLDHAAATVVDGAMYNSGQSCCGIERAYVHEAVYDDFLAKAKKLVEEYKIGDPKDKATHLGPLAKASAADIIVKQLEDAKKQGAKVLVGGKVEKLKSGTFINATLVTGVKNDMPIMQDENFGPVLPVMKVASLEKAIECANDSHYGLTAAIFTQDMRVAAQFAHAVDAGTIFMNRCDYLDPALPWTGVKDSGVGSALSKYGFINVTRRKALHFRKSTKG